MGNKILIAYATRYGSTGEVAQAIGNVFQQAGIEVDILNVNEVLDVTIYRGAVIGSAARMGRFYSAATRFVQQHVKDLSRIPIAYFYVGATMNQDTLENRKKAGVVLAPLRKAREPERIGFFGGKIDPKQLEPFWRFVVSFVKEGEMAPGDHRDWVAIDTWAKSLIPIFIKTK